jgi:hypothetical protein
MHRQTSIKNILHSKSTTKTMKDKIMLLNLPEDILFFIITLVATSSLKDLLHLRQTCKFLKDFCLNERVLKCCALDVSFDSTLRTPNELRDSFHQLLRSSKNREFCFRMGMLNIRFDTPNYDYARELLNIAVQQGHDGAKYALGIINIFSGNVETHDMGRTSLTELWSEKKLFECRQMILESLRTDGYWHKGRRPWPNNLVFSNVCVKRFKPCKGLRLKRGRWIAYSEDDYEFDICINCRLDVELKWFLVKVDYKRPDELY